MAYAPSEILTAIYQSLGPSISADAAKETAIKKAITTAFVEAVTILEPSSTTSDVFNMLWFKLAFYKGSVVAVGINETTMHAYKVYHDYLQLQLEDRLADTDTTTSEPAWS